MTATTAEAWSLPPQSRPDFSIEIENKLLEFRVSQTVPVASELMFLASQAGDDVNARLAADLIVKSKTKIGDKTIIQVASRILGISQEIEAPARLENTIESSFVRESRKILAVDFRNPVLLMDVARDLTIRGHEKSALRYVRSALALAPHSRFIVRAAARYYLHVGDIDQALNALKRSPLLQTDPWIQASEIAISSLRGKNSTLVKQAIRKIEGQSSIGIHLSELGSAVATVELQSGANKKAKQIFQKVLARPTDNSLAQAEWAAARLKLVVDEAALRTPLSFEANSNNAYRKLLIADAIKFAKEWSADEPFASRPYDALCYLYSLDGQFEAARMAAESAIKVDGRNNFALEMNLLFANIQCGMIDAANDEIIRLAKQPDAKQHAAHLWANAGALAYLTGDLALGRDFYQKAIRAAKRKGASGEEALARGFFARAAVFNHDPNAQAIIDESAQAIERLPSPGAIFIVRSLVEAGKRQAIDATAAARVAKRKWEWDAATNTLTALE